jgi:hypothetical protein
MKFTFVLLSMLVAAGVWFLLRPAHRNQGHMHHVRLAGKCLLAGLATYFFLGAAALVYLALTSK